MSVVIITGSSGLVGSEAVNFFCKKGFDVTIRKIIDKTIPWRGKG